MNLIAAVDKNWAIGKNNELLVSIPNDMKMFRQMTTGKVVVMGRKTLESFPNGLPLKNRVNIVLTKNQNYQVKGAIIVHSVEEVLEELKKFDLNDVVVDVEDKGALDFVIRSRLQCAICRGAEISYNWAEEDGHGKQ